jgi:salicylate hydroxylase
VAGSGAPVLIAGGGIGGLAAAVALAREGLAVHVLEAAQGFGEIGAGLQIGPNGTRILADWGLGDALHRIAGQPDCVLLKDGMTGAALARVPLGEIATTRYGAPYLTLARHELHRLLLHAAQASPNIILSCDMRVASASVIEDNVFIGGANGEKPLEGCGLVAADGVHSVLRRHFAPEVRAMASGRTALRALVTPPSWLAENEANAVCVWMAPGAHLVHYPIGGARMLNVVAVLGDGALPADREAPIMPTDVQAVFRHWTRDAQGHHRRRRKLEPLAALRHAATWPVELGAGDLSWRCRPSAAAIPGLGRGHGDRGCRRAGAGSCAHAR